MTSQARMIVGVELDADVRPTGRKLYFQAENVAEAVRNCLYTLRLKNGGAKVGPTGQVVYDGFGKAVVFARGVK